MEDKGKGWKEQMYFKYNYLKYKPGIRNHSQPFPSPSSTPKYKYSYIWNILFLKGGAAGASTVLQQTGKLIPFAEVNL